MEIAEPTWMKFGPKLPKRSQTLLDDNKKRNFSRITEPEWMNPNTLKRKKEEGFVEKIKSFLLGGLRSSSPSTSSSPMDLITTVEMNNSVSPSEVRSEIPPVSEEKEEEEEIQEIEEDEFKDGDQELTKFWNGGLIPELFDVFMLLSDNASVYKDYLYNYELVYDHPVKLEMLGEGANGYTTKAVFPINGKNVRAVLKGSKTINADNLFWEWKAGLAINTLALTSPIFLSTYGLYWIKQKNFLLKNHNQQISSFKDVFLQYPTIPDSDPVVPSCIKPLNLCLMTQFVPTYKDFYDFVISTANPNINKIHLEGRIIEIISILHMIYASLGLYQDIFTHYDLHLGNVLLCLVPSSKYVTIQYIHEGKTYHTNTRLIPVLIDYGRAFYDIQSQKSKTLIKEVCDNSDACPMRCGSHVGYGFAANSSKGFVGDNYFINQAKANPSHDLKLLVDTLANLKQNLGVTNMECARTLKQLIDGSMIKYTSDYGTPPLPSSNSSVIQTVHDAFVTLKGIVNTPDYQRLNTDLFRKFTKLGTLSINLDNKFTSSFWTYEQP